MAKNNDETVEPTVTFNKKKLTTAGWIAGGVLALGATFAAGAAVGHALDGGPRGDDFAAGQFDSDRGQRGGENGGHGMGGHGGKGHGPNGMMDGDGDGDGRGHMQGEFRMDAPADGSTGEGTVPAPSTTP